MTPLWMMTIVMIPYQPPAEQATQPAAELSLLSGSDPMILGAYQWALAHSASLQRLVRQLAATDRKARYRLVPGLDRKYSFWVTPRGDEYEIDVEVPVLAWRSCGDALEAWVASSLFLVLEVVKDEKYRAQSNSGRLAFLQGSIAASFAFQNRVKGELQKADPGRLKDLPDGALIYASRFEPARWASRTQRLLPAEKPSAVPLRPKGAAVTLEDRAIGLPALPRSGAEGRSRFKAVHAQIADGLADLKRSLEALHERPEARQPLPAEPTVPPQLLDMGSALLGVIDDPEYLRLERAFLDTWKGWQAALVEGGLAKRARASADAPEPRSPHYEATRKKGLQLLLAPSRALQTVARLDGGYRAPDEEDGFSPDRVQEAPQRPEERAVRLTEFTNQVNSAQNRMAVTDLLLPDLSTCWNPLVDHLEGRVLMVMNQEQHPGPLQDETITALRLHARLAVLDRFRKALWYCDLVWCQIADVETPPSPPKVSPLPAPSAHP